MVVRRCVYALINCASIVLLGLQLSASSAYAGAPPKQLYNKTIEVRWAETSVNRRISDSERKTANYSYTRNIYVSNIGRGFSRLQWQGSGGAFTTQSAPGENDLTNRLSFSGNTMALFERPNGAVTRRESVTFDTTFSGCSASVQVGKSGASPHWTGADHAEYELIEITVQSATCAIRDGNAFAN
jgi:hypothetical protein